MSELNFSPSEIRIATVALAALALLAPIAYLLFPSSETEAVSISLVQKEVLYTLAMVIDNNRL